MFAKIKSLGIFGMDAFSVVVEADISRGLPRFDIVGLPDTAVKESRERVRAAIKNCRFEFPVSRITVNIAPADIKKEGPFLLPCLNQRGKFAAKRQTAHLSASFLLTVKFARARVFCQCF